MTRDSLDLVSADSLAWSYAARRQPPLPDCPHARCNNCIDWASQWGAFVVEPMINPRLYGHPMITAAIPKWWRSRPQAVQIPLTLPSRPVEVTAAHLRAGW